MNSKNIGSEAKLPLYNLCTGGILGYYSPPLTQKILNARPNHWADLSKVAELPKSFAIEAKNGFFSLFANLSPVEIINLSQKISGGKVDGSEFEGKPKSLMGIILAHPERKGQTLQDFVELTGFNPIMESMVVRWFFQIKSGDTPDNNRFSRDLYTWCHFAYEHYPELLRQYS